MELLQVKAHTEGGWIAAGRLDAMLIDCSTGVEYKAHNSNRNESIGDWIGIKSKK